jgi:hypothetical protein
MGSSVGSTSVTRSAGRVRQRIGARPRALAAALALLALLAFAVAFWIGRATSTPADTQARAIPLRPEQRSVEVVGLGGAARIPALRPPPARRIQRPVVIVGQG